MKFFRFRSIRLAAWCTLAALCLGLLPTGALAASASVTTGDALIEQLAAASVERVTLAANVTTSANLSVHKPVELAGFTWTISGGTVSLSSAVTGGRLALTGSALVTVTGSVPGGVQVGEKATLLRDTASLGAVSGTGTVRVLSAIPGLAETAGADESVQQVSYADGAIDLFNDTAATAGSAFWLLGEPSVNYALPREIASVTTDLGCYVPGSAAGTLLMQYTVAYALDGGAADPQKPANPTVYTAEDSFTLSDPVKQGCIFAGWTAAGGTEPVTPLTVPVGTTGALHFTAHWTLAGGGTGGGSGWSSGGAGGLTGITADADETDAAGQAVDTAEPAAPAAAAAQGSSGARVVQASSGTKVTIVNDGTDGTLPLSAVTEKETPFPWAPVAAGALLLAALTLLAVLAKRRSNERMRLLMEKLNIRE